MVQCMAVLYDKTLELNTLFTLTEKESEASSFLLSIVTQEFFNFPPVKQAFTRFSNVLVKTGKFLVWDLLCSDQTLDDTYKSILLEADPVIFNTDEAELACTSLNNYRVARLLNTACAFVLEELSGKHDVDNLVEYLADALIQTRSTTVQKIYSIGSGNNTNGIVRDILSDETELPLIKTKLYSFDKVTGGLPRQGLVIFGAPTGGGKSTLGQQLIINMYTQRISSAVITLEMREKQYMSRILSNLSGVGFKKIKNKEYEGTDKKRVLRAYKKYKLFGKKNKCRLSIYAPTDDITLTQALMAIKPNGYKVIVLDYIGLFSGMDGQDQWKAMMSAAREAKRFSDANECLVIMLAQLDDDAKKLRHSKGMKDHADNVWFWAAPKPNEGMEKVLIKQVKGRDTPIFDFSVSFDFSVMKFWDKDVSEVRAGSTALKIDDLDGPISISVDSKSSEGDIVEKAQNFESEYES